MSGKQFDLAKTTAFAILDTLGDDDYVNLITFSDNVRSVVPCFREKMVIKFIFSFNSITVKR